MRLPCRAAVCVGLVVAASACEKPKQYTTNVEILKIRRFGQDANKAGGITEIELKFSDCPGDARKVLRADKSFSACGAKLKQGDRVSAEVLHSYARDRGVYRGDVVKLDNCPVEVDAKDEANYELVQECRDLKATGADVGVHCDRARSPAMLAKCPWLRRR